MMATGPGSRRRFDAALGDDPSGTVVALAGSLPPGAPVDGYARLARLAAAAGARAAIDIDGEPLLAALAAKPWLVKVNAREAATITGGSGDRRSLRRRRRATGARG